MKLVERAVLTLRTARHLRPSQLLHRVRLRGQRRLITAAPKLSERVLTRRRSVSVGWPGDFTPLDARPGYWPDGADLVAGRISLLGVDRPLGEWRSREPLQLWRYHLHYWDWAWALSHLPDPQLGRATFCRLFLDWRDETRFGQWDEWSPYVVALRAWSWCGQYDSLVRDSDIDAEFVGLLALHAGYLRAHLELDVGGNHLVKDLKALVGLGCFFGDDDLVTRATRRLRREVARQVLPDGGHVERAPGYHCQVLGDLIDLAGLLGAQNPTWLTDAIERMRRWLGLVLLPDGTVPLLNDGFAIAPVQLAALDPGPPATAGLTLLPDSGLAILRNEAFHVLADVGLPCPADLPAHAHADTLGCLVYIGGVRVVGEAGTSTYEPGAERSYERGTAAHSTVQIDEADSTEVWGAFRAARRARPCLLRADDDGHTTVVSASHDGYARLPGASVHTRTWTLTATELHISDDVTGRGSHDLVVRLHGTPPAVVHSSTGTLTPVPGSAAAGWERRMDSIVLEHREHATLPWHFETTLRAEEST